MSHSSQTRNYDESHRRLGIAASRIAGASLTRSKAPGKLFDIGTGPLYASCGRGAILTDVDGNDFIDMICALGAISLGYGEVARPTLSGVYSLPHWAEGSAANDVVDYVAPWASSVRFVKTGSEATHAAYRIAKAATGRRTVLIGDWSYHGWHEWCSGPAAGLATGVVSYPHCFDVSQVIDPESVAAIFVEPHRWEAVSRTWLQSVRDFCSAYGILLVFDEMIYGGRWALGGATEFFGVTPDLACFGKAIGNGAPIACVVGGAVLADHGQLISGTYSGDVGALVAVTETIAEYRSRAVIERLWSLGRMLRIGLDAAVAGSPVGVHREGADVHQRLRFDKPEHGRMFSAGMAARGILWHPDVVNVCAAHTEQQIWRVVESAFAVIRTLKDEL